MTQESHSGAGSGCERQPCPVVGPVSTLNQTIPDHCGWVGGEKETITPPSKTQLLHHNIKLSLNSLCEVISDAVFKRWCPLGRLAKSDDLWIDKNQSPPLAPPHMWQQSNETE